MTKELYLNGSEKMRVLDMHAHLSCFPYSEEGGSLAEAGSSERMQKEAQKEISMRESGKIATFFSCKSPKEWELIQTYRKRAELLFSFGIHPWVSDRYCADDCMEYFRNCDAVGEIGMDSVWCEIPLDVQRRQLERQLMIAADLGKPVVLHTKGQESVIAEIVNGFPNPVCVHWYSGGSQSLEKFLEMGCYFTLGPDLASVCRKPAAAAHSEEGGEHIYFRMLREIPAERLFLETDGISAVAWALGERYTGLKNIRPVLSENMRCLAGMKKMKEEELCRKMWENLGRFLGRDEMTV